MAIENFEERFKSFKTVGTASTNGFLETLDSFEKLCKSASINTGLKGAELQQHIKAKLTSNEAKPFWKCIEKRGSHKEYYDDKGKLACKGKEILVVGAGPCGLRMAIECAFLGASVTVVDMRQYISRNNVLHLWPFVIQDVKAIGGKVFNPRFCVGAIDHVSIKRLQLLLLKICLLMGVKVYTPVQFKRILDPNQGSTWRVEVAPENHVVNKIDFDFIVGANGKNNSLPDFTRKTMRGKLAIAITANFVNNQTSDDARVTEIGGLSYIFDQEFFNGLKEKTGGDLENFVYFKDDTHYFVMTPKKACLLKQGVIKQDYSDAKKLLSRENIDRERLHSFARDVVDISTNKQLPTTKFAVNHHNEEDIAIFDFTSISMANHSCYVKEMHGKTLVQCIVGDSLLEPFWPTGTGCARGFLGVFDAAWFIRQWCINAYNNKMHIIAERETVFRLLSQTKPESSMSLINKYTIDPQTRYGTKLKVKTLVATRQIQHLYKRLSGTESKSQIKQDYNDGQVVKDRDLVYEKNKPMVKLPESIDVDINDLPTVQAANKIGDAQGQIEPITSLKRTRQGTLNSRQLLAWYQEKLEPFSSLVTVKDLNQSWIDGIALCALIETFRPTAISIDCLEDDVPTRLQIAFILIEQEFGVSPMFSALEICEKNEVDKLAMLSYLAQIRQALESEPVSKAPKLSGEDNGSEEEYDDFLMDVNGTPSSSSKQDQELDPLRSSMSPHGMLVRVNQETAMQGLKQSVENAQVWMGGNKKTGTAADVKKKESMRRAILMSTNQMPSKLKSSVAKKGKLTRKKVLFKEPPPSVSKFRVRESQDIDIGGSGMPMNLNLSEEHNSTQVKQFEDVTSDRNNTEEPKSLAACAATPLSDRLAHYNQRIAENQGRVLTAKKQPGVVMKRQGGMKVVSKEDTRTPIHSGRPSLAHCRGIAVDRIKRLQQNSWQRPAPEILEEESSNQNVESETKSTANLKNVTPVQPKVENKPASKGKNKSGNFFDKLKGLGKKKNRVLGDQSYITSTQNESPNASPVSTRRGIQQVPSKMFESMSYMACMDRAKRGINRFEDKTSTPKTPKEKPSTEVVPETVEEEHIKPEDEIDSGPQSTSIEIVKEEKMKPSVAVRINKDVNSYVQKEKQEDSEKPNHRSHKDILQALDATQKVSVSQRINSYIEDCEKKAGSNICCICEKKLYLIERHAAHGKFFHKSCYRCTTCDTLLRVGNSLMKTLPDNKVEFYCFSHAYIAGVFDVEWNGKGVGDNESSTDDFLEGAAGSNDDSDQVLNLGLSENMEDIMVDTREFHTSDEDESLDDDDFEALVAANTEKSFQSKKLRNQSMRSQKSLRLLVADEIQRGLDEVDADEEQLEKEGHVVEDKLRNRRSATADDEVMEEWLEVLRKKKELVDKESKLMLKKKMVELQDRQNRLQLSLSALGVDANTDQGVHTEMAALEQDTEDLEMELECLVVQMKSLSCYLDSGETNV